MFEPTIGTIRNGDLIESSSCDFKGRLDLDDPRAKSNLINDVVAFLNAGAGHLVVGVHEKRGSFSSFEPIRTSKDEFGRRLISTIQDNIDPKPLHIDVRFLDIDDGFLADVVIPEHRLRPYQNAITGGFYIRTGAQNTPLSREEVRAMFVSAEQLEASTLELMKREDSAVLSRGMMQLDGSTLHIAIVPYQHYQRDLDPFDPGSFVLKMFRPYHWDEGSVFRGCQNGVEVVDTSSNDNYANSRLFIGDDWLVHSYVAYPITFARSDRLKLQEFEQALARHLRDIQLILSDSNIRGPFSIMLAVRNLNIGNLARAFPNTDSASLARPMLVERLDEETLLGRFNKKIKTVSIYGR